MLVKFFCGVAVFKPPPCPPPEVKAKDEKRMDLLYFADKLLDPFAAIFTPKVAPLLVLSDDITKGVKR